MKQGLLILLAVCTLCAAMIPRERRAINTEEDEELIRRQTSTSTTTEAPRKICAPQTPCAWSIYKPVYKIIDMNFTNTYCVCGPGLECQMNEDDSTANAFVYRCRPPASHEEEQEEEFES